MRYKHDCTECIPLGEFHKTDLYYCEKGFEPTVIARRSDEGSDYESGMKFATKEGSPLLYEAKMRAVAKGYIV